MHLQDVRNEVASQIANLPDDQIEAVWSYLNELTKAERNQTDLLNQYLTFWCGNQLLGTRIDHIIQIIPIVEITSLPDFPPYMKGVISLREEMIPVMDLRLRLGKEETPYTNHTCIVIINIQGRSFGLIVDGVEKVERIPEQDICPPPKQTSGDTGYLMGIAKREHIILILSVDYLLSTNEISTILNLSEWENNGEFHLE